MEQILGNLVANAIKFTSAGSVTIIVEPGQAEVRVAVRDSGPGIPDDQRARVFERFWQAQPRSGRDVGLGLYIAKALVEAHGGRIGVESTPGEGSTFWFSLPTESRP